MLILRSAFAVCFKGCWGSNECLKATSKVSDYRDIPMLWVNDRTNDHRWTGVWVTGWIEWGKYSQTENFHSIHVINLYIALMFTGWSHSFHWWNNLTKKKKKKMSVSQWTQQAHDVNITSPQRRCNVMTLHRRWGDVIFTSCARWEQTTLSSCGGGVVTNVVRTCDQTPLHTYIWKGCNKICLY